MYLFFPALEERLEFFGGKLWMQTGRDPEQPGGIILVVGRRRCNGGHLEIGIRWQIGVSGNIHRHSSYGSEGVILLLNGIGIGFIVKIGQRKR